MPLLLYPRGKSTRYPLDRRLSGPHSWSGRYGEMKILCLRDSNSDLSFLQPIGNHYIDYSTVAHKKDRRYYLKLHRFRLRKAGLIAGNLMYRVYTTKCPDLDVLEIGRWFLSSVRGLLRTTGVQIPPPPILQMLCCLTEHRWSAPPVLT
jgi:hypothetical protein